MKREQIMNILHNERLSFSENMNFASFAINTLKPKEIADLAIMNRDKPNEYVSLVRQTLNEGIEEEMSTYNQYMEPSVVDEIMKKGGTRKAGKRVSKGRVSKGRVSKGRVSKGRVSKARVSNARVSNARVSNARVSKGRVSRRNKKTKN